MHEKASCTGRAHRRESSKAAERPDPGREAGHHHLCRRFRQAAPLFGRTHRHLREGAVQLHGRHRCARNHPCDRLSSRMIPSKLTRSLKFKKSSFPSIKDAGEGTEKWHPGNMKDIKRRIKSVQSTMRITTKAMELVASSRCATRRKRPRRASPISTPFTIRLRVWRGVARQRLGLYPPPRVKNSPVHRYRGRAAVWRAATTRTRVQVRRRRDGRQERLGPSPSARSRRSITPSGGGRCWPIIRALPRP